MPRPVRKPDKKKVGDKPPTRTVTIEEPTVEDLLKDPLVRKVMDADGVNKKALKQTLDDQKID